MPSLKEITSPIANELLGTSGTITAGSRVVGGDNKNKPTTTTSSSQDDDDLKYIGTSTLDEQLAKKKKDAVDLCDSDTGAKPSPVDHQLEKRLGIGGGGKKSGSTTDNSPKKIKAEGGTKKKRKKSILEQMTNTNDDGIDEKDIDEVVEKENSKNKSTTKKAKKKKKSDSTSKSKDIRKFYSLSPKEQQGDSKSPMSSGKSSEEDVTPTKKKRKSTKVVSLNENAKPIHLHIPFIGESEKHTFVSINAHCVDSKYDVSSEPIVLKGKQPCRAKSQIKNFLSGFGRYIH